MNDLSGKIALIVGGAAVLAATNGYLTGHVIDIDGGHLVRQYATR